MGFGRPPKYETPEEMQHIVDLYFLACKVKQEVIGEYGPGEERLKDLPEEDLLIVNDINDQWPTISGLSYALGFSTEAFRCYEHKDNFLATVKRAKQRVEMHLEQRLYGQAPTGSIFSLKNNFGWKDKQEVDMNAKVNLTDMTDEELDRRLQELEQNK